MKNFLLLAFYSISLWLVSYLSLDMEGMIISEMAAQVDYVIPDNVLLDMIENMRYWNKFSVIFTFLFLAIKCFLIALILYAGLFFANIHTGVRLGRIFKVTVFAESIMVVAAMVRVIFGAFSNFTYSEFSLFSPLSLLSFIDYRSVQPIFYYPLQVVNAFELIYCIILVYFFKQEFDFDKARSSKVVLSSYGFSMSFWIVLVMFLTLNFK